MLHKLNWVLGPEVHLEVNDEGQLVVEDLAHRFARLAAAAHVDATAASRTADADPPSTEVLDAEPLALQEHAK